MYKIALYVHYSKQEGKGGEGVAITPVHHLISWFYTWRRGKGRERRNEVTIIFNILWISYKNTDILPILSLIQLSLQPYTTYIQQHYYHLQTFTLPPFPLPFISTKARCGGGGGGGGPHTASRSNAIPCPPPIQADPIPYFSPRRLLGKGKWG